MKKNAIIAALVALIIGIGVGFAMGQVNKAPAPTPTATSATTSESQAPVTSAAQTTSSTQEATSSTNANTAADNSQSADSENTSQTSGGVEENQGATQTETDSEPEQQQSGATQTAGVQVDEDGTYTSKDEVAAYIHEFGHLPSNYISKSKAKKAGWVSKEGNLDEVLPGMSIGGSEFYNNEGQLPDAPGRTWTECDINYEGGFRGAERIVFSNDGLIFYTADHYETFEQLY